MYARYLKVIIMLSAPLIILYIIGIIFLINNGEHLSAKEIVDIQLENQSRLCLVSSGVSNIDLAYKKELLTRVKPRIAVFGSSRVLNIRSELFKKSFVNGGLGADNLVEGGFLLDAFLQSPELLGSFPEVIIIGIDISWFLGQGEKFNARKTKRVTLNSTTGILLSNTSHRPDFYLFNKVIQPYKWSFMGNGLSFSQILNDVMGLGPKGCGVGLTARYNNEGFDASGYRNRDAIVGLVPRLLMLDFQFEQSLRAVYNGQVGTYGHGKLVKRRYIDQFLKNISKIHKKGIRTVLYITPYAGVINDAMTKFGDKYQYMRDLKIKLKQRGIYFHDFSDMRSFGASDCEFLDGEHAGDVIAARILKAIYNDDPLIREYLDIDNINYLITKFNGRAFVPNPKSTTLSEINSPNLCYLRNRSFPLRIN